MVATLSAACFLGATPALANEGEPTGSAPDATNQDIAITA